MNGRDYDVGLHAVTNFTAKGAKKGPLARILRQLRFKWEDFALAPQKGSRIVFPETQLRFDNDIELLRAEVNQTFPKHMDEFDALIAKISDYDELDQESFEISGRKVLEETISEPLLIEMLLCPLMWYGNAAEHDMAWGQFCIWSNASEGSAANLNFVMESKPSTPTVTMRFLSNSTTATSSKANGFYHRPDALKRYECVVTPASLIRGKLDS